MSENKTVAKDFIDEYELYELRTSFRIIKILATSILVVLLTLVGGLGKAIHQSYEVKVGLALLDDKVTDHIIDERKMVDIISTFIAETQQERDEREKQRKREYYVKANNG